MFKTLWADLCWKIASSLVFDPMVRCSGTLRGFGTLLAEVHFRCSALAESTPRNNLSVCESKQTVAEVWRPCPSRDTARFTLPREYVPRAATAPL
jgi:hypothetical protein